MLAGAYSPNGKSVSVLPSSSVPSDGSPRVTRIVPTLAPGTPVLRAGLGFRGGIEKSKHRAGRGVPLPTFLQTRIGNEAR